jgi:DNA mismatch endonuclease, patch repair protein
MANAYVSWASSEAARRAKIATRSRDTRPEVRVRSVLHRMGYRFRVCVQAVPTLRRSADIVFPRLRLAVFIDGCFWHGCPEHYNPPRTNAGYWVDKIKRNVARDRDTNEQFRAAGWQVLRLWEHIEPSEAARAIAVVVDRQRSLNRSRTVR